MRKRTRLILLVVVAVVAVVALALPMANLIVGLPANPLTGVHPADPVVLEVTDTIATKCASCHASQPSLPFYAKWPVADEMIARDVTRGTSLVDYVAELTRTDQPVSEVTLARTEYVLRQGTMPPLKYRMLHWNHGVSTDEREAMLEWVGDQREAHYADPALPGGLRRQVVRPLPRTVEVDERKADLGRRLFNDVRLSADNTLSCASCHGLDTGGTDQRRVSVGVGGAEGPINSPTVFNAVLNMAQFWDGRAPDLAAQADGPVNNPIEMGSNWPDTIAKLNKDRAFTKEFRAVYPEGYTPATLTDAIATFEATLITPDSPFDNWLRGDDEALTPAQVQGWNAFKDYGCTSCHAGEALGGRSYETMGLRGDYFGTRETTTVDNGRYNVTGDDADLHKFKVPTLRNVTLTWPYLHNGSTNDLSEVVALMAEVQCGRTMSPEDVDLVVAFLGSLTGTWEGRPLGPPA